MLLVAQFSNWFCLSLPAGRVHVAHNMLAPWLAPWLVLFLCTVQDGEGIVIIVREWLYKERMCTDHTGMRSRAEYEMQECSVDADGNVLMV